MNFFKKSPEYIVTIAGQEIPVYFNDEIALKMHKVFTDEVSKRAKVEPKYFCVEHAKEMIWIALLEGWNRNKKTRKKPFPLKKDDLLYLLDPNEFYQILITIQKHLPNTGTGGILNN